MLYNKLTQFSFHLFTPPDFVYKFALKSIHVGIQLMKEIMFIIRFSLTVIKCASYRPCQKLHCFP